MELVDDVLQEIFLRLPFTTGLICAASVCRRWLRLASDPDLLRRFRNLHPPPLLGFFIETVRPGFSKFVPMPHLPMEFASVIRRLSCHRAGKGLDAYSIVDCRNGYLLVRRCNLSREHALVNPLHGESGAAAILPPLTFSNPFNKTMCLDANGVAFAADRKYLRGPDQFVVNVHKSQGDAWHHVASPEVRLPFLQDFHVLNFDLLKGGVYIIPKLGTITSTMVLLHLGSSAPADPSIISLPLGVADYGYMGNYMMWFADDSDRVYLVDVDTIQISVRLHNRKDNWSLVDSISLEEVCSEAGVPKLMSRDERRILAVGEEAEFLFLKLRNDIVYIHLKRRMAEKVHTLTREDVDMIGLVPFTMTWPPKFPLIKDVCSDQKQ